MVRQTLPHTQLLAFSVSLSKMAVANVQVDTLADLMIPVSVAKLSAWQQLKEAPPTTITGHSHTQYVGSMASFGPNPVTPWIKVYMHRLILKQKNKYIREFSISPKGP